MAQVVIKDAQVPEWAQQLWNLPQKINIIVENVGKIAKETDGRCYLAPQPEGVAVWCRNSPGSSGSSTLMTSADIFDIAKKTGAELKKKDENTYIIDGEPVENYMLKLLKKAFEIEKKRRMKEAIIHKISRRLGVSILDVKVTEDADYASSLEATCKHIISKLQGEINRIDNALRTYREISAELKEKLDTVKAFLEERGLVEEFIEYVLDKKRNGLRKQLIEDYDFNIEEDEEDYEEE